MQTFTLPKYFLSLPLKINLRILPFEAYYPNKDLISSPELFFDEVSNQYIEFKKAGFFKKTGAKSLYVYEISNTLNNHRGLIASHDVRDYTENKILGHENTLAEREQQIMQLMMLRKAMIKPGFAHPRTNRRNCYSASALYRKHPTFSFPVS
ncbi:MAG: DUF1015 family protein [Saprospiraceae bacterium]|nr:DUF1015 family protein [Saprospiraceae bacterium]